MTCDEVQRVTTEMNPKNATRALIAAVVAHVHGCRTCAGKIKGRAVNYQKDLTAEVGETKAAAVLAGHQETADQCVARTLQDREAVQVVLDAVERNKPCDER